MAVEEEGERELLSPRGRSSAPARSSTQNTEFFSFSPGPNLSVDRTESGPRLSNAHFDGPTVSVRFGRPNLGRSLWNPSAHASVVRILSFLLFLSWRRALKRRSNHLDVVWIPLEARHLNRFKNTFKGTM